MIIAVRLSHRGFKSPGGPQGFTWGQIDPGSRNLKAGL